MERTDRIFKFSSGNILTKERLRILQGNGGILFSCWFRFAGAFHEEVNEKSKISSSAEGGDAGPEN